MSTAVQKLFDLTGRTALVTGGSRGLGLQIAEALGEAGAKVLLTSRKASDLEHAAAALQDKGIDARWVAADASEPAGVQKVVDDALQRLGTVDILVNNAGATWGAPAEDHPLEAWDKVMNLNVRSVFMMSQAIGKACMIPRRYGRIINVASIAGLSGSSKMKFLAYGTSKGAVVNLTRTLAGEWGAYGITVNALAPGFFPSKMTRGTLETVGADKLAAMSPLGRIGDDDDLKGAALLFASAAGKHITGQILAVDGGVSAVHGGNEQDVLMKRDFPLRIPFVEHLGLELWGFGDGKAELRVDLLESHLNSWEVAHGGVLMTLLDVAMAHAARASNASDPMTAPGVATIEMKTTFMRPAEGELRALGHLMHRTSTMAFCEGRVLDGHGELCAHATATFKYLRALPSRGRTLKNLQEKP